jgi:hypothetical protein
MRESNTSTKYFGVKGDQVEKEIIFFRLVLLSETEMMNRPLSLSSSDNEKKIHFLFS